MTKRYSPTWWERGTNPDLVTRGLNVGAGAPIAPPGEEVYTPKAVEPWLTQPGMRPNVTQRMLNFIIPAATPAVPCSPSRFEAIGVIFNVYSTAAASAFWGTNGVTVTTGIEIRPGFPEYFFIDQMREIWELQRSLEHISAMMAAQMGGPMMGPYMAPKVIIDLSQIYLASVAAQNVSVIAFLPPEFQ